MTIPLSHAKYSFIAMPENVTTILFLLIVFMISVPNIANAVTPWFEDGFEWNDVLDAKTNGPWSLYEGNVSISNTYAHSGNASIKICYGNNEAQSFIAFDSPGLIKGTNNGQTHIYLRWWELRGPNYDWSGEKFNRVMGLKSNDNVTLDYPLGWVADGGWGQSGTNDAGSIQMFGNSTYSNGLTHWKYTYKMPREEWHVFEYELKLNDVGTPNGVSRLWIDDHLVAEAANVEYRYANYTLDRVWIGGWYSGGVNPDPSPACRYVDDVAASTEKMGLAPPKPPTVNAP